MRRATLALMMALMAGGCQEELDIATFAHDYAGYERELRIEALLDADDPQNSIVRADWTMLVTDTSIFNGRDDDGDWDPATDDLGEDGIAGTRDAGEGNGRPDPGEPHVDEYDEILPQIHDTTLTIFLWDVEANQIVIEFAWESVADSFVYLEDHAFSDDHTDWKTAYYGAYRPATIFGLVPFDHYRSYEFVISSDTQTIRGATTPFPPVAFLQDDNTMSADTMVINATGANRFRWTSVPEVVLYWVTVERIFSPDSTAIVTTHPAAATDRTADGFWIGEDIMGLYFPGLYKWTIRTPSEEYATYFFSNLPIRDEQLSNLRDADGDVVLGVAGSIAVATQYVRVPE